MPAARVARSRPLRSRLLPCTVLVAVLLVGACDAGGGSGDASGGSPPPSGPGSSSTAAGSTSTSAREPDGDGPEIGVHRAQPANHDCGLTRGQVDLADMPGPDTSKGSRPTTVPLPTAATPVPLPGSAVPVGRRSNWFVVGDQGLVRIDPRTGAPDRAFVLTGDCVLWSATAGDGPDAAVLACTGARDAASFPEPCSTIVVSVDDGATVARWDVPDGRAVTDLGLHDGQLITAEASSRGGLPRIVRVDARTGEGTQATDDYCVGPEKGRPEQVVDGTALVVGTCPAGPQPTFFLIGAATSGHRPLGTLQLFAADIEGDGEEVWAVGMDRFDTTTLERIGPSLVDPARFDQLVADGWGPGYGGAIEVPGALWIRRCVKPCAGPVTVEIARIDLATGATTDTWQLPGTQGPITRGTGTTQTGAELVAADEDGAWFTLEGRLGRLNRPA